MQYEGVIQEHRAVRTDAGAFDVSHMGEIDVEGPRAHELLQSLLSNDLGEARARRAQYTLLTNEHGGIIDDLIAYRLEPLPLPARRQRIESGSRLPLAEGARDRGTEVRDVSDEYALIAVQGPNAIAKLGLEPAPAFTFAEETIDGVECMVNRTGYTGEDGCEILCMAEDAVALWDAVLARGVVPCGLGARDTLRLEASLPLHGNDIGPDTDADLCRPRLDMRARRRSSPARRCCAAIKERGRSGSSSRSSWRTRRCRAREWRSRAAAR